uniref:Uncharacterized protein n=1 Tax=Anguilla anguilla TaxID=7936 RepID=A0A0E9R3V3_ANGAN
MGLLLGWGSRASWLQPSRCSPPRTPSDGRACWHPTRSASCLLRRVARLRSWLAWQKSCATVWGLRVQAERRGGPG